MRVPPDAVYGRYGGEEFAVMLVGVPLDGALSVAEHLRAQVAALEVEAPGGPVTCTASFGIATTSPGEPLDALYRRADAGLYHAKNSGRNQVAVVDARTL